MKYIKVVLAVGDETDDPNHEKFLEDLDVFIEENDHIAGAYLGEWKWSRESASMAPLSGPEGRKVQ